MAKYRFFWSSLQAKTCYAKYVLSVLLTACSRDFLRCKG